MSGLRVEADLEQAAEPEDSFSTITRDHHGH